MPRTQRADTEVEAAAAAETTAGTTAEQDAAAAESDSTDVAATEQSPDRGHVRRDGGRDSLQLPPTAVGNVVVYDMTQLEVVAKSGYDVADGKVVRRGGVWAAGADRWLVEYDRNS